MPWQTPLACQVKGALLSLRHEWIPSICVQLYSTVKLHSLLYKLQSLLSDSNHLLLSYGYRPRRSFLSRSRRIWARSRLGSWCPKPCQVSACVPLSIWSLASSSWRDATFKMGTVVGRPWAHCKTVKLISITVPQSNSRDKDQGFNNLLTWKHRDVAFSSSIIRQHSDGSKESPNMIAPTVSHQETSKSNVLSVWKYTEMLASCTITGRISSDLCKLWS